MTVVNNSKHWEYMQVRHTVTESVTNVYPHKKIATLDKNREISAMQIHSVLQYSNDSLLGDLFQCETKN